MREVLEVKHLSTEFTTPEGVVRVVDDVSFTIEEGATLCLVGESGCGKSMIARSILRIVPSPPGRIAAGEVLFRGRDLLALNDAGMGEIRGNRISMIFQEPMTSLNPLFTVGEQIAETIRFHQKLGRKEAKRKAIEMLRMVEMADPERRVDSYPHELSGGMRQRAMIAIALSCHPTLLIADEPTTALDVTIQAQILELIDGLRKELGMAVLLITHDLGVVAERADEVIVMYAGKVVEKAKAAELFRAPRHPYTIGLLSSLPKIGSGQKALDPIPGTVPSFFDLPSGCRFRDRCPRAAEVCARQEPTLTENAAGHWAACHLA
jgi:oligopeptide/dipeptide ABC transporter ATP-binding protein